MRRFVLLFLLLFPAAAFAQSGAWGLRGITRRLLATSSFVVAVDGRGVAVYDATTLQRVDVAETEAESVDGAFAGDMLVVLTRNAFERFSLAANGHLTFLDRQLIPPSAHVASNGALVAAAGADGVRVYANTPSGMPIIAAWAQNQRITALAWRGNALFVAVDSVGVPVLDGMTGQRIGYVGESAVDIAIDGDLLYAASAKAGFAIWNVDDPTAPQEVGRGITNGVAQLVAVGGGRAIVADDGKKLTTFDVSAPDSPRAFPPVTQPVEAVAVSGAQLFVSGSSFDENGIETASGIPVRAYDVSDPASPHVIADAHDLAGPVNGAATDGTLAFISDPPFFRVIDVSTTAAPREIASLRVDDIGPFVKSAGARVILYGKGNVQYIDVSNPYKPRLAGLFQSLGRPPSAAAIARNSFLEGNTSSGFHVFDFLPDGTSRFIAGIKTHPVDIVTTGDAVYYDAEWQSVGIADISSGARLVNSIHIQPLQLALADDLLLVRDVSSVHVMSVADPFNPVELSQVPVERGGVIAAESGAAYVAMNGTISRMDLSNPASPSFQPTGLRVVAPSQIAATNGKIVVADRYGLRVFGPDSAPPPPRPPVGRHRAARP